MKARIQWNLVLTSILYLLLGVVLLVWPDVSSLALAYCVGTAALLYGIFNILAHFLRKEREGLRLELPAGILAAAFGLFTLFQPTAILSVLPIALGLVIALNSAVSLRRSLSLRSLGFPHWWVTLLLALATLALGLVAIFRPFRSFTLLLRLIGGVLIYSCISDLWMIRRVSVLSRAMTTMQETHTQQENAVDVPFEESREENT